MMIADLKKMFRNVAYSCILLVVLHPAGGQVLSERIHFADASAGGQLLATRDAYTDRWSWFDVQARLGRKGHPRELLEFASEQTRDWTEEETGRIVHIVQSLTNNIGKRGYDLQYPDSILFVKSTCREEGGAEAYTRSNYIVLKQSFMQAPYNQTRKIVAHELFHVLSRHDSVMRRALYSVIGFEMCNEIRLPPDLNRRRISNPDAPINDTFITLKVGDDSVECAMIIYSERPYTEGSFFNYLNLSLVRVAGPSGLKEVVLRNDQPVLYSIEEVEGFYEQIGRNTRYIIHPEEILADNFTFAVQGIEGVASPEIIENMDRVLRGHAAH